MNVAPHPLGVRPEGNALLDLDFDRTSCMGLLGLLRDDVLMSVLQELNPTDLLAVAHTCKALYAYAHFDELWKHVVYAQQQDSGASDVHWCGTWRRTALHAMGHTEAENMDATGHVYSDFLFRPFELSQIDYHSYITRINEHQIPRMPEREMTPTKFTSEGMYKRPFIVELDKPIAGWSIDMLVSNFGREIFRQEYMDWPLATYVEYMRNNSDETPLYLFDCTSTAHGSLKYEQPLKEICGSNADYFALFGRDRPDHQWLIIGPERSGSTFHKDPNGTSAWNSVVCGSKYWIMFPPSNPPPGVWTDDAQSEVTAPVSLAEWFAGGFYAQSLNTPGFCHAITKPGECMFVPSQWWHAVVNLEDCIAMTGNFVPRPLVTQVAEFLRCKPDQISGFKDPDTAYERFVKLAKSKDPSVFDNAGNAGANKKRRWNDVVKSESVFSFGFA